MAVKKITAVKKNVDEKEKRLERLKSKHFASLRRKKVAAIKDRKIEEKECFCGDCRDCSC